MGGRSPKGQGGGRDKRGPVGAAAVEAAASAPASAPWAGLAVEDAVLRAFEQLATSEHRWQGWIGLQTARVGRVPIPVLRDLLDARLGRVVTDAEFKRAMFALEDAGKVKVLTLSRGDVFSTAMHRRSIPGERETFGYLERP